MPPTSSPSVIALDALRAQVCRIERAGRNGSAPSLKFGIEEIDCRLTGNGLAVAAFHEVTGTTGSLNDDAAATLFAAGITARLNGIVLWVFTRRDLFAPALAQAGLPPDRLIHAECSSDAEALAVMEEGLRHGGLSAVVGEIKQMTMAASRRLQLAAEAKGVMMLALKRWRRNSMCPLSLPSAAATRWRVGCVPSQQLEVGGIARPRWSIGLVRQRGGAPHHWIMEGTDEAGRLALPAEPSHRPAAADRWAAAARHAA